MPQSAQNLLQERLVDTLQRGNTISFSENGEEYSIVRAQESDAYVMSIDGDKQSLEMPPATREGAHTLINDFGVLEQEH